MAQPKKKTSKPRTNSRRSQIKLATSSLIHCEKCHQAKVRHQICESCGTYKNVEIVKK